MKGVTLRPCELQRRRDGTWQRNDLAAGAGTFTEVTREIDVAVFISETPDGKKFAMKLGRVFVKQSRRAQTAHPWERNLQLSRWLSRPMI